MQKFKSRFHDSRNVGSVEMKWWSANMLDVFVCGKILCIFRTAVEKLIGDKASSVGSLTPNVAQCGRDEIMF